MRYRYWIMITILLLGVIVMALVSYKRASLQIPQKIVIATGSANGYYDKLGGEMKEDIERAHPRVTVKILQTNGSQKNRDLVENKKADFGFYQNNGNQNNDNTNDSIRAVANLYSEALHLIVKKHAGIQSINDLKGKIVAIGSEGSGTRLMALEVLNHYGIKIEDFKYARNLEFNEIDTSFASGNLDAAFVVMGIFSPLLINLFRQHDDLQLVSIEYAEALSLKHRHVSTYHIPEGAYKADIPVPDAHFTTIAVKATLVTTKQTPAFVVKSLTELLLAGSFRKNMNLMELDDTFAQAEEDFKLHRGALAYYRRKPTPYSVMMEGLKEAAGFLIILVALASGIPFVLLRRSSKKKKLLRDRFANYARKLQEQMSEVLLEQDVRTLIRRMQMFQTLQEKIVQDVIENELGEEESMILLQLCATLFTMSHFRILSSGNQENMRVD